MTPSSSVASPSLWSQYWQLTKPRVVALIVFCAWIGMLLAQDFQLPWLKMVIASFGIWCVSAAAAAFNCLVEQKIDAVMKRTQSRPLPQGTLTSGYTAAFSLGLCSLGMILLYYYVNTLTMWLTFATFVGYAVIYTIILKPATPQNIVIGGASGAMPPVLGWAAITGEVTPEAMLLFLIIFVWTPPHFWALALYRAEDYAKAGLPMLPVTHGSAFTRLHILLYTFILLATTSLPFVIHMAGWVYFVAQFALGLRFIYMAWRLYQHYSEAYARKTFMFSIYYLAWIFTALLGDHYLALYLQS
jgi:protoheme IX farnesyltransferase